MNWKWNYKLISEQQSNTDKWTWWIFVEHQGRQYYDLTQEGSPENNPTILNKMLNNINRMINKNIL